MISDLENPASTLVISQSQSHQKPGENPGVWGFGVAFSFFHRRKLTWHRFCVSTSVVDTPSRRCDLPESRFLQWRVMCGANIQAPCVARGFQPFTGASVKSQMTGKVAKFPAGVSVVDRSQPRILHREMGCITSRHMHGGTLRGIVLPSCAFILGCSCVSSRACGGKCPSPCSQAAGRRGT